MANGLGQAIGRNFAFPFLGEQGKVPSTADPNIGGGQQPELMSGLGDLQAVEGVTDEVYQKFYDLRNFAGTLWKNYGVDVTQPDISNPLSIEANKVYQKAVADLHYKVNELQQSRKGLEEAMRQGHTFAPEFSPTDDVYNVGMSARPGLPQEVIVDLQQIQGRTYTTKDQVRQVNEHLNSRKAFYEDLAQQYEEAGHPAQADVYRRAADAYGEAVYDPTTLMTLGLRERELSQRKKETEKTPAISLFHVDFKDRIQSSWDPSDILAKNTGATEDFMVSDAWRTGDGKVKVARTDKQGRTFTISIDPEDPKSYLDFYNQFQYQGKDKLSLEDIAGIRPDRTYPVQTRLPYTGVNPDLATDRNMLRNLLTFESAEAQGLSKEAIIDDASHVVDLMQSLARQGKLRMPAGLIGETVDRATTSSTEGSLISDISYKLKKDGIKLTITDESDNKFEIEALHRDQKEKYTGANNIDKLLNENNLGLSQFLEKDESGMWVPRGELLDKPITAANRTWRQVWEEGYETDKIEVVGKPVTDERQRLYNQKEWEKAVEKYSKIYGDQLEIVQSGDIQILILGNSGKVVVGSKMNQNAR